MRITRWVIGLVFVVGAYSFASATPPPPSPGQVIGATSVDRQIQGGGSQGRNVARTPSGTKIHFTWIGYPDIYWQWDNQRYVNYASYTDVGNYPTMAPSTQYGGFEITNRLNRGSHVEIDVDATNHAILSLHGAENDYSGEAFKPWCCQFPFSGDLHQCVILTGYDNSCPEQTAGHGGVLWPRMTSDRSSAFLHEIAHSNIDDCPEHKLWYWRFNGTAWTGPALVSQTPENRYVLASDATSDKVAIVTYADPVGSYRNVEYIESQTNGSDWLALVPNVDPIPTPTPITSYGPSGTESAWINLTTCYDNAGVLHVMFDVQDTGTTDVSIKHWNSVRGTIRTVTIADWDNPVQAGIGTLNLANLSMGIGDGSTLCDGGSNDNYLYATYVQFGGRTQSELNDHSSEYSYEGRAGGYMNGEIYLTISSTSGNTWSPPVNLTNTKTPECHPGLANPTTGEPLKPDSVCRSENWATMGRMVKDIDVFFISDLDAGAITYSEGSWQMNPVHYLQISGSGIAPAGVCPLVGPAFQASLSAGAGCEYHGAQYGQDQATLTLMNLGNAELIADVAVTDFPGAPSMSITGTGPFSIPAGAADLPLAVTLASNGAPEDVYSGMIEVTHNDATQPSPRQFPVTFYVFNTWTCPGCPCPCKHDPACDGTINVLDVVATVNVAFRNDPMIIDGECPVARSDVEADGATTVTDVVKVINVAFRNQAVAGNFVDPCL